MAFKRIGFGQVEGNQLSGIKTGQIYASLPLDNRATTKVDLLQNGEFMFYDYASGCVTGDADNVKMTEAYLVYNEIKIYENWLSYKDFAMMRVGDNYVTNPAAVGRLTSANTDGTTYGNGSTTVGQDANPAHTEYPYRMDGIAPRLVKTNIGDIMTTNMVKDGDSVTYTKGNILGLEKTDRNTLQLAVGGTVTDMQWVVAKVYTMPDGQPGLKLQRIQ